jgi:magnesium transporter
MSEKSIEQYISNKIPRVSSGKNRDDIFELLKSYDFTDIQHIFIVDSQNRLDGFIDLKVLFKSKSTALTEQLMQPCHCISIESTLEYAANHSIGKSMDFVPVIDEMGIFLGIIPTQTLIEILRREHIQDMDRIAGIQRGIDNAGEALLEPSFTRVGHRLPWLLVGLVGSFLTTFIMAKYEDTLNSNISLAFFIPGIVYLADAIGTQTETIVIRGLSLSWTNFLSILKKEMLTGWLIGLILGLISLPIAILGGFGLDVAVIVSLSVMVAGTIATTIGLLLPWSLQKLGVDPAFGSGPLATIVQDILSIMVYLMLAYSLLGAFN